MNVTMNETQLELLDRVVSSGRYGSTREAVLRRALHEQARHILSGGSAQDPAPWTTIEVDKPAYGKERLSLVLQPGEGKAVPVYTGEVLRLEQITGGQCVDFNGYNLHDYKEWLDCGFNRQRGIVTGPGTIVWSGSPRGRPMYLLLDMSESCDQFYEGHRCNSILLEREYGIVGHPTCQDAFAEAIAEWGLTPDDVHDSYNFWMSTVVDEQGRRSYGWNRGKPGDYADILALFDTLSVPVCCPSDLNPINNYDPQPVRIRIFEASPETLRLVALIQEQFGRYREQKTPADFRRRDILARRALQRDPDYHPVFRPMPRKIEVPVELTDEDRIMLEGLMGTGVYGDTVEKALLVTFLRWYDRTHLTRRYTKLKIRDRQQPATAGQPST